MNYSQIKTTDGTTLHRVSGHQDHPSKITIRVGGVVLIEATVPPGGHIDLTPHGIAPCAFNITTEWMEL